MEALVTSELYPWDVVASACALLSKSYEGWAAGSDIVVGQETQTCIYYNMKTAHHISREGDLHPQGPMSPDGIQIDSVICISIRD